MQNRNSVRVKSSKYKSRKRQEVEESYDRSCPERTRHIKEKKRSFNCSPGDNYLALYKKVNLCFEQSHKRIDHIKFDDCFANIVYRISSEMPVQRIVRCTS